MALSKVSDHPKASGFRLYVALTLSLYQLIGIAPNSFTEHASALQGVEDADQIFAIDLANEFPYTFMEYSCRRPSDMMADAFPMAECRRFIRDAGVPDHVVCHPVEVLLRLIESECDPSSTLGRLWSEHSAKPITGRTIETESNGVAFVTTPGGTVYVECD